MTYVVSKDGTGPKAWRVQREFEADGPRTNIGSRLTRKEAIQSARLLAGWRGTWRLEK